MYNINKNMNSIKDFHKKTDGVVVNVNSKDHMRARNRNHIRRVQQKMFGDYNNEGDIDKLKQEIHELKKIVKSLIGDN
jgi:hypothetical protein